MSSKHIVIVGGAGAGADTARALSEKLATLPVEHSITLLTDKDYFPYYIPALRAISAPVEDREWFDAITLTLDNLFTNGKGKIVVAKVVSIQYDNSSKSGSVLTEKGDTIPFDILVLGTGSIREPPLDFGPTKEEALRQVISWREKIRDAKGIVLVGGGAVGVELSGEIRDQYPSKTITIVHDQPFLLNSKYPEKFRRNLADRVLKRGIQIVLNDSINLDTDEPQFVTAKGYRVDADLMIRSRGVKPNTTLLQTLSSPPLTSSGYADVEATLQLKNYPTIFALGDLISWDGEVPQKGKMRRQVPLVCSNILDLLAGQEPKAKYSATFEMIFVTIGKSHGAGYIDALWGVMLGNWLVSLAKGKALFLPFVKKSLGYPA